MTTLLFAPSGSSPLTRGGLSGRGVHSVLCGLIPAYAGRTRSNTASLISCWAHPRLRGADADDDSEPKRGVGSSPLTRGGLVADFPAFVSDGLIPAYAGRTCHPANQHQSRAAHPRLRGADKSSPAAPEVVGGSSPLTRGGRGVGEGGHFGFRLIPAYAGRTVGMEKEAAREKAHPRLRGADSLLIASFFCGGGSSPLTRGGLEILHRVYCHRGLIPAYAGRTSKKG